MLRGVAPGHLTTSTDLGFPVEGKMISEWQMKNREKVSPLSIDFAICVVSILEKPYILRPSMLTSST